jgi:hypothetical protein
VEGAVAAAADRARMRATIPRRSRGVRRPHPTRGRTRSWKRVMTILPTARHA